MNKIAVLLPTYNAAPYIKYSIDSILNQTYSNFDLYIYDDCSTDNTEEIIRSINDSRIHYIKNEVNLGIASTLNKGLNFLLPLYEFIARMDADDWSYPERFKEQINFLKTNDKIVMCGTQGYWIKDIELNPKVGWEYPVRHDYIKYYLLFAASFNHQSIIFKSSFIKTNNLRYDESIATCEDWELWTRIIKYGKISNLSSFLIKCRILPNSNHHSPLNKQTHLKERSKIISDYWRNFNIMVDSEEVYEFYYCEEPISQKKFIDVSKIFIRNFNSLCNEARADLTEEEYKSFSYMLARKVLSFWRRSNVSRLNILNWFHILKEVTFMGKLKLIRSIIR